VCALRLLVSALFVVSIVLRSVNDSVGVVVVLRKQVGFGCLKG
jgi:hypothetical protein